MATTKRGRSVRGRGALALLGALVTAMALSGCGDAPEAEEGPSPTTQARPGKAGAPREGAAACGWIPADAKEATPVASLHADRASDPLCADTASVLDVPKALAASLEEEL